MLLGNGDCYPYRPVMPFKISKQVATHSRVCSTCYVQYGCKKKNLCNLALCLTSGAPTGRQCEEYLMSVRWAAALCWFRGPAAGAPRSARRAH